MRNRELPSSNTRLHKPLLMAAALTVVILVTTAAILYIGGFGFLTLSNAKTGEVYGRFLTRQGKTFSVGFIHSVNKSPVTDFYEMREDGIYVVRTVYYGFGAGVQTQIEEGQTLEYGEDGSMIVSGFNQKIPDLIYFVGTVSDHILTLEGHEEVSLRDLCGRNAMVRFNFRKLLE